MASELTHLTYEATLCPNGMSAFLHLAALMVSYFMVLLLLKVDSGFFLLIFAFQASETHYILLVTRGRLKFCRRFQIYGEGKL